MQTENKTTTTVYEIASPEETEALGAKLVASLGGGDVVLLSGELGAGKTVFCKGMARALGITSPVVSPTFTIMNEYVGGRVGFCHFDAYRLENADEAYAAGLADFIGSAAVLCAVEWWENIVELFDGLKVVKVAIVKTGDDTRRIEITR